MHNGIGKAVIIAGAAFIAVFAALTAAAIGYFEPRSGGESVREINMVSLAAEDGDESALSLPSGISGLRADTIVSLRTSVAAGTDEFLYVKSVYAPLRVYYDGALIYENGQSHPSFMRDPATFIDIIPLPAGKGTAQLRLDYAFPHDRSTLALHAPMIGSETAIVRSLFAKMGFQFIFSVFQIFCGIILTAGACCLMLFERKGGIFIWLGLFALSTGLWAFGECNLTGLLIHNPTLLYIMAFSGMFIFPVPIICFCLSLIDFRCRLPLQITALIMLAGAAAALGLQLAGTVPLSKSMYAFHILIPLSLCTLAGFIIYESAQNNRTAHRFLLPVLVVTLAAITEVVNYVFRFTDVLAMLFQVWLLVFLFMMSAAAVLYVRDAMRLKGEAQELKFEMGMMEYRIEEQQRRNELLMRGNEETRRSRHDMRHQLAVLRSYGEKGEKKKILDYINELSAEMTTESDTAAYCENQAVSAIVAHYARLARKDGVELTLRIDVPASGEGVSDSSLCVVFGNLMENAVEACRRMGGGKRFIVLKSRQKFGVLTITMDNSFDGNIRRSKNGFLSVKRDGEGIGLRSVAAVAEKHGGTARFDAKDGVFSSSVFFNV